MVNVEEFANRLKTIMDYYEISAASLAENIDIQRSSISHILSGRNKPSLDFVLKILKNFPEVELYWLLNGTGKFPKQGDSKDNREDAPTLFSETIKNPIIQEAIKPPKSSIGHNESVNEIERIVVFYKNGTFKNYIA